MKLVNRLTLTTKSAKTQGQKLFCAFLTLGFPDIQTTEACIWECEKAGVDILELGFPFSDPLADGPTIQKASEKAIQNGIRIPHAFELMRKLRSQGLKMPVVFFKASAGRNQRMCRMIQIAYTPKLGSSIWSSIGSKKSLG